MKKPLLISIFLTALSSLMTLFAEVSASGGEITYTPDGFVLRTFKSSGTLQVSHGGEVEILLVAGGGGGGRNGGGGGAGGLIHKESFFLAPGEYPVVIGEGGDGGTVDNGNRGINGGDSSFAGLVALGGGGGGGYGGAIYCSGSPGGSGGGAKGNNNTVEFFKGGEGTEGQGFSGGDGISNVPFTYLTLGAGGGGAGGPAANCDSNTVSSTSGGIGLAFSRFTAASTNVYYAGGGGGGGRMNNVVKSAAGGLGGGGDGSITGTGNDGVANTGGGGGGGALTYSTETDWVYHSGGKGGSGILVIRYKQAELNVGLECTGGDFVETDGEYEIRTFTQSGVFTADKLGSVEVLVVGGGGGGGFYTGGGGGAGGVLYAKYLLTSRTVQVKVGAGGASDTDGENSSFGDLIAYGGGAGGQDLGGFRDGHAGGSGGGGAGITNYKLSFPGGVGVFGQGHAGGIGTNKWHDTQGAAKPGVGGGGGGAGAAGGDATSWLDDDNVYRGLTGAGGDGKAFTQFNKAHTNVWYGGGGSGGGRPTTGITIAEPGKGGGGKGTLGANGAPGSDGLPNTGGGGGGGGFSYYTSSEKTDWQGTPGGNGGSGIVIVRYKRITSTMIFLK